MTESTPTTPTIEAIAAKRGIQTLAQGLLVDVTVAVALVVLAILPGVETWGDVIRLWPAWLLLIAKSITQAVVSWIVRRWGDSAGVEQIVLPE